MKYGVYSIYDTKAEAYYPPFMQTTKGLALRLFTDMANDRNTNVGRHPGDYHLFNIGNWDDGSCQFDILEARVNLGAAIDYVKDEAPLPGILNREWVNGELEDGGV